MGSFPDLCWDNLTLYEKWRGGREENGCEWKEGESRRGRKEKENFNHRNTDPGKKEEADTSGNQRNASQLGDPSIHPSIQFFLLHFYLKPGLSWGWGEGWWRDGDDGRRKSR